MDLPLSLSLLMLFPIIDVATLRGGHMTVSKKIGKLIFVLFVFWKKTKKISTFVLLMYFSIGLISKSKNVALRSVDKTGADGHFQSARMHLIGCPLQSRCAVETEFDLWSSIPCGFLPLQQPTFSLQILYLSFILYT